MPSISKKQQNLFRLVWAVRQGKVKRSDVDDNVLRIVDSDLSDYKIKAFATSLQEHLINKLEK